MIDERDAIDGLETERYELFETPSYRFDFDRRFFIKAFGAGIVFIFPFSRTLLAQQDQLGQGESGRRGGNPSQPNDVGAWIHIDEDGGVTVYTGKVEMGQNIRTSLAQAVAEELHVPLTTIHLATLTLRRSIWGRSAAALPRRWLRSCGKHRRQRVRYS